MNSDRFGRGQKIILVVMALALIGVLVVLGLLLSQGAGPALLPTLVPSSDEIITETVPLRTSVPIVLRPSATPVLSTPVPVSPTLDSSNVPAEVRAARRIEALTRDVGQIRELPKQREVPLNFLSEEGMIDYLRNVLADSVRQDFVQRQQILLAALDLLPRPDEAFPPPVQTRAGHLIAFYDPIEAQIFLGPAGREGDPPDVSLVHQYAHALVDQHFSLASAASAPSNADAIRARDALIEGDAMAVLLTHLFGDVASVDEEELTELAEHLAEAELTDYEGYLTSQSMQTVFLFPYRQGTRFVAALLRDGWWPSVNAAYLDLPLSTEQILHPEKYIVTPRDTPRTVRLPDLREDLGADWRLVARDVLGELILRAHLDQYLLSTPEAEAAAAGWDGDLAVVWQDVEGREVLVMRTLWDSVAEADEFVQSYFTVVDRRLRGASRVVRPLLPPGGRLWRGETGNAYLEQNRNRVLIIWAPDTDTMERVLAVFVFEEE